MNSTKFNKNYPYAIGIDLGTSNSCVAVKVGSEIKVIDAKQGVSKQGKTLASCVSFTDNEILVGDFAKNRLVVAPEETVYQAKRHMGTAKTWNIKSKTYRPEQIAAYIISKLKQAVQLQVEAKITDAVVTVPAQFDDLQRKATEDAVKIAGLNCLRLINEPTAAALAYDFKDLDVAQHIIVADLGGGTFDVSILHCEKSVFTVIATGGDTALGGKDIDDIMIQYVKQELTKLHGSYFDNNIDALEKIRTAVEQTKIALSNVSTTQLIIPFLGLKNNSPVSVNLSYSRSLLQKQMKPILDKIKTCMTQVITDAKLDNRLNKLLLVGGPMNMPIIKKTIQQQLNLTASTSLNPNNCVAIGAAKQAAALTGTQTEDNTQSNILLLDVTPLSLGLAVEGNMFSKIIQKNSHIPTKNVMKYTTAEDNQQSVEIRILQGQRPVASDNKLLHTFSLKGIPKMKRGEPIIQVTFEINASGVLSVRAQQSTTKISQEVTVVANKNLSQQQIDRMIQDAEANKTKDQAYKQLVETVQRGKSTVYALQEAKSNQKLKLTQEQITKINVTIEQLNASIKQAENIQQKQTLEQKIKQAENMLVQLLKQKQADSSPEPSSNSTQEQAVSPD